MNVKDICKTGLSFIKKNLPSILTCTSVLSNAGAVIYSAKLRPKYDAVRAQKSAHSKEKNGKTYNLSIKDEFVILGQVYWPVMLLYSIGTACSIGSNKTNIKRTAAALAAYEISQRSLEELKEAAVKTVGEKTSRKIRETAAKDIVRRDKENFDPSLVEYTGHGDVIFRDAVTGGYFKSNKEFVDKTIINFNLRLIDETMLTVNDFLASLDRKSCLAGDILGFNAFSNVRCLNAEIFTEDMDGTPIYVLFYDVEVLPKYLNS